MGYAGSQSPKQAQQFNRLWLSFETKLDANPVFQRQKCYYSVGIWFNIFRKISEHLMIWRSQVFAIKRHLGGWSNQTRSLYICILVPIRRPLLMPTAYDRAHFALRCILLGPATALPRILRSHRRLDIKHGHAAGLSRVYASLEPI
jgi:hypothetical protein